MLEQGESGSPRRGGKDHPVCPSRRQNNTRRSLISVRTVVRSFWSSRRKANRLPGNRQETIDIAVVQITHPEIRPTDTWDLFGWGECEATVEPQGFTQDGRVMLLARPSTSAVRGRNDCVSDWGLYATNMKSKPIRLPDGTSGSMIRESDGPRAPGLQIRS